MTRQVKIGLTLGSLLVLGWVFALDALVIERSLTGDVLGWEETALLPTIPAFDHVLDIVRQQGFSFLKTDDAGFLSDVLPEDLHRERMVLLKDGDRAAFVEWIGTDASERYFLILKTVLHQSFSQYVEGVQDEEWSPSVSVLTFHDPEFSEEWFIFARLADQLLEFRIPHPKVTDIRVLLEALHHSL